MKNALILSGGGFRGSFQVGVVEQLLNTVSFDVVSGISVGSLNGALIAQNRFKELKGIWLNTAELQGRTIIGDGLFGMQDGKLKLHKEKAFDIALKGVSNFDLLKVLISKSAREKVISKIFNNIKDIKELSSNTPLANLLRKHVDIREFKLPFLFSVVSLEDGKVYELTNKDFKNSDAIIDALLACSGMPVIFKPIDHVFSYKGVIADGVDGGLRTISPLSQTFNFIEGDEEEWTLWVVNCQDSTFNNTEVKTAIKSAKISLDILLDEVITNDINLGFKINRWAKRIGKKKVRINVIKPKVKLRDTLDATKDSILYNMRQGTESANYFLRNGL